MSIFWEKNKEGNMIDALGRRKSLSFIFSLGRRNTRGVVDLRLPFRRRYPVIAASLLLVTVIAAFGARSLLTKAEVTDFHPLTCLGSWEHTSRAEGKPEALNDATLLTADVSAIFTQPTSQIFCGNFIPDDFKEAGTITSVGLTFTWKIEGGDQEGSVDQSSSEETVLPPAGETNLEMPTSSALLAPKIKFFRVAKAEEVVPPEPMPAPVETVPEETPTPTPTPELPSPSPEVIQDGVSEPEAVPVEESIVPENDATPDATSGEVLGESQEAVPVTSSTENDAGNGVVDENQNPEIPSFAPSTPPFLRVSYSLDGTNWFSLADVSREMLAQLTVSIPLTSWSDLKKLQIGIEGVPAALPVLPRVLLDGMLLEVHYEIPPLFTNNEPDEDIVPAPQGSLLPVVPVLPAMEGASTGTPPSFGGDESPSFELDMDSLTPIPESELPPLSFHHPATRNSLFGKIAKWLGVTGSAFAQQNGETPPPLPTAENPIIARVFNHGDDELDILPQVLLSNNRLRVNVPQPADQFAPGKYLLRVWVWRNGNIYYTENSFTWGVLAMNPNKFVYLPGETSKIGIAVLDEGGDMVCDANVRLEITTPSSTVRTRATSDGSIVVNEECNLKGFTERPDYETDYQVEEPGIYQTRLTATTENGTHTIYDSFEVRESVSFDIERKSATRIYPPTPYPVRIAIKTTEAFSGDIEERVPLSFEVKHISHGGQVVRRNEDQVIRWAVDLPAGGTIELLYDYLAPEVSPQFYLLGPLRVGTFSETRRWQIAADAIASNSARTFYSVTNNAGRLMWATGASNSTGAEIAGPVGTAATSSFVKAAHGPTRDEILAGMIKRDGLLALSLVIGNQDAAGDAVLQFDQASVTSAQACDAVTFGSCWRAFDIAYEQLSGEGMVAFASTTASRLAYRTWDGTNWSPATTSAPSVVNMGGTGAIRWVRLIPRGEMLKGSRSDEILVITSDANSDIFAGIWNGSAWTATTTITAAASTFHTQNFDGAWEESSGDAMVVWAEGTAATTTPYRYKKWTRSSTTWASSGLPLPAMGASHIGHWVAAKAAPIAGKNHIAVITSSATAVGNNCGTGTNCRAQPFIWDGSGFTMGNEWTSQEPVWQQAVNVAVESVNTNVQVFYASSIAQSTTVVSSYETWIEGTGFSAVTTLAGSMGDDLAGVQTTAHPNSTEVFVTVEDVDADCNGIAWNGATTTAAWDITGCNSAGETALAPLSHTAQPSEGSAFWVVAKPYSPWQRNWRFYGDITENDPDNTADVLGTSENGSPAISQEGFARLRMQFVELTNIAQTDARKKIQWTTENPDYSTSTWTDVGDTSETGAVWRYATAAETCANCSDNTTIGATRLTGSSQSGTYISDKDAAAGTGMDHTALALSEYDYPIKAENATSGTTYYFRAYDNDQLTPVFREQDSDGSNDCSSAACVYPSATVQAPANNLPTLSALLLNGGSAITVIENTSTSIAVTGTATDLDGNADISFATGTIYRSGVGGGASCTSNENNCYRVASSSCAKSNCSGNSCDFTCTAKIQYFADPTDSGAFSAENWLGQITATDAAGATGVSTTVSGVELNTLFSLNITNSINFGSLLPGGDSGAVNQIATTTNTGNAAIDVEFSGTNMVFGANTIAVGNERYATSTFTYSSCTVCTALTTIATAYELDLAKPTSTAVVEDTVFWGLSVPNGNPPGSYTGTSTFTAVTD
ncbi:MAG: hypothetical protein AAB495_02730 [Patescibacteria group bacterium]